MIQAGKKCGILLRFQFTSCQIHVTCSATRNASRSVLETLNVISLNIVLEINALTLVLEFVDSTLDVWCLATVRFVCVRKDIWEIHMIDVSRTVVNFGSIFQVG